MSQRLHRYAIFATVQATDKRPKSSGPQLFPS